MREIVFLLAVLLVGCITEVCAQERIPNAQSERQQTSPQPTATPLDHSQNEINKAAEAERKRYQKERDDKEDASRAKQAEQGRIIVIATVVMAVAAIFSLIVAGVYAYFAWRTLKAVGEQASHAAAQVRKMQGQLRVMKTQAEVARKGYLQTTKLTRQNEAMVQAMRGQLTVMKQQLTEMKTQNERLNESVQRERAINDPRLRVAEVTAENFEVGKRPFYVVTIANDGLIAATGVRIHISIEINNEKPLDWINDVVVTIPANGKEHHFIHSSFWLSQEQLDNLEQSRDSLRVVGFCEYWPVGRSEFCYKYLALQGEDRPSKIPQFVPCDYTPRLNTTLRISGVESRAAVGSPTVIQQPAPENIPTDDSEKTEGEKNQQ